MERELQPIYCLSDSQLLFWREEGGGEPWLADALAGLEASNGHGLRAAYVGASSGDEPAFYSIFQSAVESAGIADHRMILSTFGDEDRRFLDSADLVVLSGGDPVRGWRIFEQSGLQEAISRRYFEGAILLGVSAGAVQFGWVAGPEGTSPDALSAEDAVLTFRLVPAALGVHDEASEWSHLRRLLQVSGVSVRGLGIPSGGGLIYHPDGAIEPVRLPVHELVPEEDGGLRHSLLFPGPEVEAHEAEPGPEEAGGAVPAPRDRPDDGTPDGTPNDDDRHELTTSEE